MERHDLEQILQDYKNNQLDLGQAMDKLRDFPTADLDFARLDTHRKLRTGYPEVVYSSGKSPSQLRAIVGKILSDGGVLLATRASQEQFDALNDLSPNLVYHQVARIITTKKSIESQSVQPSFLSDAPGPASIAVLTGGTSDIPVAEEAALTAECFGNQVDRIYDVGVAGIHRLFAQLDRIKKARVVIAIAGMEGALASVIGGLVEVPVIAVPTSVGYGANFGGLAALLAMLNSCAAGISVVNIDNGFGAGYLASLIVRSSVG